MPETRKLQTLQKTVRQFAFIAILSVIALCGCANSTFSQTTKSSTQQEPARATNDNEIRLQLVAALERAQSEVKTSRNYIAGLEKQVRSKEAIINAQNRRQTLSDAAIASLKQDVVILGKVIAEQKKTIEIQQAEVNYLKKQLDETNKKLRRSRILNKYLIVGAGVLLLTVIFK